MLTVDILRDEHNGVLTVLEQLERAADAAEGGVPIPVDLFAEITEFFTIFVDCCHHGKEEIALFPALGAASWALQARLADEHEDGRRLARSFATAAAWYTPGDADTATAVASAARAYAGFLRRHIALETAELFPLIERTLTPAGDAALVGDFARLEETRIGPGTHERLHGMIASLAPRITAAAGPSRMAARGL